MTDKKPVHILLSSTLATTLVAALTNPLDVLKVRVQTQAKDCASIDQSHCVNHNHKKSHPHSIRQASLYRLIMTPNLEHHYKILCDCLPFRSNTKALIYIIRKEGLRTLANGLTHSLAGSILSTATYFFCYEEVRKQVKKITSHPVGIPLLSALAARTITTCVSFPFEYWRTLQQSVAGVNVKSGFKLGTKINSGFVSLMQRDLLFSGLYWVLVENIRAEVKSWRQQDGEGYLDKKNLLLSNVIAGGLSGAIAATVTLPLDVVKTRRQLYPKEYKNRSTYSILNDIYVNEGKDALFSGMRQRVAKVTMACAGILTLYEFFSDLMRDKIREE